MDNPPEHGLRLDIWRSFPAGPPAIEDAQPAPAEADGPLTEDGRVLRLACLPLGSWCVSALLDVSTDAMLGIFLVSSVVAVAAGLFRR
ncbi:hypothetical protein [Roseococcus sp. YIM B11640]|uniref:hypothetical protein n=1 Tax=Roseococcus sp. YIM B11640 TaxID=3133973 RepID=UPI003C7DDEDF